MQHYAKDFYKDLIMFRNKFLTTLSSHSLYIA